MIDAAQSMVYVINAGGVEMAQETGAEMLDFTKPPVGYSVVLHMMMVRLPGGVLIAPPIDGESAVRGEAQLLTAAWAHYKAHNDPPGMWSEWEADDKHFDPTGDGDWTVDFANADGFRINAAHGRHPSSGGPEFARAAAWAWHDRRHALAKTLGRVAASMVREGDGWPRLLTWTDEQVAEVERWLLDSTVERPAVLAEGAGRVVDSMQPSGLRGAGSGFVWADQASHGVKGGDAAS